MTTTPRYKKTSYTWMWTKAFLEGHTRGGGHLIEKSDRRKKQWKKKKEKCGGSENKNEGEPGKRLRRPAVGQREKLSKKTEDRTRTFNRQGVTSCGARRNQVNSRRIEGTGILALVRRQRSVLSYKTTIRNRGAWGGVKRPPQNTNEAGVYRCKTRKLLVLRGNENPRTA